MDNCFLKGLLPYPRVANNKEGVFKLSENLNVFITDNTIRNYEFWLSKLNLKNIQKVKADNYIIHIGQNFDAKSIESNFESAEAYTINADNEGITITAKDEKGLTFALKTLVKIYNLKGEFEGMFIDDAPMVKMRAIHMCLFNPNDGTKKDDTSPDALKERLELASVMGYNYVFIEFWGMFPYKKNPFACWPNSYYTAEKIEEIVSFCINDLHITPCPGQNLTSHAGWSRITTRQHVSLDQRPDLADMWIPGGWCFATENPKTKQFLKDCIDELLEAFHNPPMIHCGCDKAFGFGSTEEDRTKSADLLFATHISNLNTYITSKGVRPVMWADMLYTSMDSLTFRCNPEISNMLPKNILMNIWTHNDPGEYWNDIDFFQDKGYETVYSPFVNKNSIDNMVKLCIAKNSLGIVQTTWYMPEGAKPFFVYSAGKQWNNKVDYCDKDIEELLK